MIQQALFPKSTKFRRAKRTTGKYGDPYRVWLLRDGSAKVVETKSICSVAIRKTFKAIVINEHGEALVSVHRKLRPALAAVVKATEQPKPTNKKRKQNVRIHTAGRAGSSKAR